MSRNVSAARAHSAKKSHIPTMHQPTLRWRKISIIRVSSCWRWRGDWGAGRRWGGLRLDSLPVFSTATHSKSAATPPHIPPPSPQPLLRQTIIIFPPISVPLHVSTAANIIREVSASAPHSGKSNLPRFPSAELRSSFKQGQQGKKHWVKDDDVHAGKKGKKAPQCGRWRVEGGLPWERRPTCVGCTRGDTRNGTTHSKTRTQQKTEEGWGGGNTEQHSDPPSWLQGQNFTPSVSPRRTRMYRKVTDTYLMPYSSEEYTRGWRKGQAVPGRAMPGRQEAPRHRPGSQETHAVTAEQKHCTGVMKAWRIKALSCSHKTWSGECCIDHMYCGARLQSVLLIYLIHLFLCVDSFVPLHPSRE